MNNASEIMKPLNRLYNMTNRAAYSAACFLALLTLLAGVYFYGALPDPMISHWNAVGAADGYMGRLWGILLMPILMAFVTLILVVIPRIDPLKHNIDQFRGTYNLFIVLFAVVLAVIQLSVLAVNLGAGFNIGVVIMPAIGVLFFAIGMMLPATKRNWFIGIRTPWTVSNDVVWERTHKLGGTIFKILGVVAVVSIIAPSYAIYIFLVPVLVAVVGLIVYSYVVYHELGIRA